MPHFAKPAEGSWTEHFGLSTEWQGFVFVTLNPQPQPLRDYLGRLGAGLEGYPFDRLTQKHTYRAEIGSNLPTYILRGLRQLHLEFTPAV